MDIFENTYICKVVKKYKFAYYTLTDKDYKFKWNTSWTQFPNKYYVNNRDTSPLATKSVIIFVYAGSQLAEPTTCIHFQLANKILFHCNLHQFRYLMQVKIYNAPSISWIHFAIIISIVPNNLPCLVLLLQNNKNNSSTYLCLLKHLLLWSFKEIPVL